MDYDISINDLNNALTHFEQVKSSVESYSDSANSSLSSYSSCESGRIVAAVNNVISNFERLTNGSVQIQEWLSKYISDLEILENGLASFQGTIALAPFEFQGSFNNMFARATVPTLKSDVSGEDRFIDVSTPSYEDGDQYWQLQGNGENCGATAFTVAVNTLLGDAVYTDNVAVWNSMGRDSTSIGYGGSTQAQDWINSQGLQDQIEVAGIDTIQSPSDLVSALEDGGVVVVSSGGTVFNRNDGSKGYYPGHYIEFYATEDGKCYANDSSVGDPAQAAGVEYTENDLQQFFDAHHHNSVVLKAI